MRQGLERCSGMIKETCCLFFLEMWVLKSLMAHILAIAILEALRWFSSSYAANLIVESDSTNDISWISSGVGPWKFHFPLSKSKIPSSVIHVVFQHVWSLFNAMADALAKKGVDREVPFFVHFM